MENKNKHVRVGFSRILWAVLAILLCAVPCVAETVESGDTLNLSTSITGDWLDVYGTLNMYQGAEVDWGIYAFDGSTVNIYAGTIGPFNFIQVNTGANVTVYGTNFFVLNGTIDSSGTSFTVNGSGTLTVTYENETLPTDLLFQSDIPINLAAPGEPPENEPPVANAGDDVTILSNELALTVIQGTATDPDGDTLQYRWLEGAVEFTLWAPVGANSKTPLDLGTILPKYLGVGTHTLTLEVKDGMDTVSDDMVLTIEIAVNIEKAKVCWHHSDIHVEGKLYLPQGVWMDNLEPVGSAVITLADVEVANQSVGFEITGKQDDKWEYKDGENHLKEFKIDWKGAKFDYKGDDRFHIHTHFISGTETTLCIHTGDVSGDFTVTIDETTTIDYDEGRSITTDVEYESQKEDNSHVYFTLPFELTSDMTIEVSGAIDLDIDVADHYEEGFVKFKLISVFNPDSSWESSDKLEIEISLGEDPNTISGSDLIDAWTKQDHKHWEYK